MSAPNENWGENEVEVNLEPDAEFEIEIVDDRPPEDQRETTDDVPAGDVAEDENDEELRDVSGRVKKRIDQLTFKYNDERRKVESAERMREEAVRFAEQRQRENEDMRRILAEGEKVVVAEVLSRTKADVDRAKQQYAIAVEEGDPALVAEAMATLNKAQIEQHQAETYQPVSQPAPEPFVPAQAPPPPQQQVAPPAEEPAFTEWKANNEWFETDPDKRMFAIAVHEELARTQESTGVIVGTDAYYKRIDERMSAAFPALRGTEGEGEPVRSPAPPVVAPAARASAPSDKMPRKVVLSPTQVDLAKRLGLTPEQYARENFKLNGAG
jgi:hypothetical protein